MKRILAVLVLMMAFQCTSAEHIVVGVTESAPFVILNDDGTYSGISVELWDDIAEGMGISYSFVPYPLQDNIDAVIANDVDVALGAISVTADRERLLDFTHPYYMSGLGIVTQTKDPSVLQLYGWGLLKAFGMLTVTMLAFGTIMRYIERRNNPQFSKFGDGMWFTIVTMTTTGYGDKVPLSSLGKVFATLMMVSSAILFPTIIASIVANIAVDHRERVIENHHSLGKYDIGVITGTSAESYLKSRDVDYISYPSSSSLISSIENGTIDGGVYDKPMLQYMTKHTDDIVVLPTTFERQYYGFALPNRSKLREDINAELLMRSRDVKWLDTIDNYLGTN